MDRRTIPFSLARRIALHAQLLDGTTQMPGGKEGVAQRIDHLGYVQIDTISVINRAHHHTLWARQPDYDPQALHDLQAEDRRIFEYWAHAIAYLPMSDYRFYLPKMRSHQDPKSKWAKRRLERCGHLLDPVKERIREEGPLMSRDFKTTPGNEGGTWWDWKPSKMALDILFWRGELMVTERRNFEKVYDLTERVLPSDVDTRVPTEDELGDFAVRRALQSYGIIQEREMWNYLNVAGKEAIVRALAALVEEGEAEIVQVDGIDAEYYVLSGTIERVSARVPSSSEVHLLSPFDNLIIQRDRVSQLFGFDYALECYTPKAKRVYGYFVLPVLWGEDLVGRLDPKADRKKKTLIVRNLLFEPGFDSFDPFLPAFARKLAEFARFNDCRRVRFEQVAPAAIEEPLASLVAVEL